ncbi:hypothetical protein LJC74_03765 [Eubacteriales bacterium OttesenSCG-928-A19]|nr:hypothetical protein [Eubacteriales bacterium OttesenSCG-928-A19]
MSKLRCPMLDMEECRERSCAWWVESYAIKSSDGSPCGDCALKLAAYRLDSMMIDGLPVNP